MDIITKTIFSGKHLQSLSSGLAVKVIKCTEQIFKH